jgi:2-polyprenyl-6-methoxyphenol hydroxylase-like FAD-dependent oxidoreductase
MTPRDRWRRDHSLHVKGEQPDALVQEFSPMSPTARLPTLVGITFGEVRMQKIGNHAVVLGAGIAGLLAARVVSEGYERVTVVERDALSDTVQPRRGVPQGRHAHNLLPTGSKAIGALFPGLLDDLEAGGAPVARDLEEVRFCPAGHHLRLEGRPEGLFIYQPSRPHLEGRLRARVRALPAVEIVDRCEVTGLRADATGDRVTGVRIHRGVPGGTEETLDADLVVDATGRGSRAPVWLAALGHEQPAEERLVVDVRYASRHLRLRPGAVHGEKFIAIGARADRPTGFVLFAQEDDRWILTAIGYGAHHPPTDPAGFLAFFDAVAPPDVLAAIREAEPLDDIVPYRFPADVRRRYDRLRRFPDGLLVFGDALCSTNPAYALGMSVAALQAVALRDSLAGGDHDLARRFFRAAARPTTRAWQLTVGAELALPHVQASRPLPVKVVNAYVDRVLTAAERDPVVAERFVRVATLEHPFPRLLRPSTMWRVLLGDRRRGRVTPQATIDLPARRARTGGR